MSTRSLRHWLSALRVTSPTLESLKLPVFTLTRIARQRISSTSHYIVPPKRRNPLFTLWVTFMLKSSSRMLLIFLISLTSSRMLTALWVARGSLPSAREGRITVYLSVKRRTKGNTMDSPPLAFITALPLPWWGTISSSRGSPLCLILGVLSNVPRKPGLKLNALSGEKQRC